MATEREVGDIVKGITEDVKVLVKGELDLAKAELKPAAKHGGVGAGLFGGAGYFGLNALSLLFIAGALGIAHGFGFDWWLGFVIMAGVLLVLAGVLALIGKAQVGKVKGPEQAIEEANESVESVKKAVERGNAAATAPRIKGEVTAPEVAEPTDNAVLR
ncbi:MAG: phage holin family protein [Propionibacteriaceae bacterium]